MKVLVTGGTGFVGSHTVRALWERGHEVRLLVRNPDKVGRIFGEDEARLELAQGDMTHSSEVAEALKGCEGVLHCAAMVALEKKHAKAVLATNDQGVRAVIGGAVAQGCSRIVHVSSVAAIFDPSGKPAHADSPVAQGESAYSQSKAAGDLFARELQAQGAPVHISYPVGVIGPDDPGLSEANNALAYMLRVTSVVSSGALQFVDVRDLAAGHAALFDTEPSQKRHLFGGHCLPWQELVDLLSEVVGHRIRRVRVPGWAMRAAGQAVDSARMLVPIKTPATAEGMIYMTRWVEAQSSPSVEELGIRFRTAEETLTDTLRFLHAAGHLSAKSIGRLATG